MATPILTLLTDFGLRDGFVASLKGVVLARAPDVRFIDISHEIEPQDVEGGAFVLQRCFSHFPPGTVHLAVVDPGVGGARRGLVIEAAGYRFVGPDNGLLTPALRADARARVFRIDDARRRPSPGRTFDGRDLFAPIAAELARGTAPAELGERIEDPVRLAEAAPAAFGGGVRGRVIQIDRFGNLITNIPVAAVPADRRPRIELENAIVEHAATYAAVAAGELGWLINSDGWLEIFAGGGSAAARLGAKRGQTVLLIA